MLGQVRRVLEEVRGHEQEVAQSADDRIHTNAVLRQTILGCRNEVIGSECLVFATRPGLVLSVEGM